jgi:hypothetical protein
VPLRICCFKPRRADILRFCRPNRTYRRRKRDPRALTRDTNVLNHDIHACR